MPVTENFPAGLDDPADDNYSFTEEPRIKEAKFGDGYELRTTDGINPRPRAFRMTWPNLDPTDYSTLITFLRARNGHEGFNWTPPGEGSSIKVKCPRWTSKRHSGPYWSVEVDFIEIFDQ